MMTRASTSHTAIPGAECLRGGAVSGGGFRGAGFAGAVVVEATELPVVGASRAMLNLSLYSHRSFSNGGLGQQFLNCLQQHREIQRFLQYRTRPSQAAFKLLAGIGGHD